MRRFSSFALASALLLATAASAQTQNPTERRWGPERPDAATMHKHMCDASYAHEAGHLATVEAMLDLTAQQKPLFDKFSQAKLSSAQARKKDCLSNAPAKQHDMTVLDREARMEKHLAEAEKTLKATRPALEAFYSSLTAEQKKTFDHMWMMHRGKGGMGHGGSWHRPMGMMHPPGPGQPPPPPKPN